MDRAPRLPPPCGGARLVDDDGLPARSACAWNRHLFQLLSGCSYLRLTGCAGAVPGTGFELRSSDSVPAIRWSRN